MSAPLVDKTASEVFEDACKLLRSSLSEDEQRALGSYKQAELMLQSIKQLVQEHPVHHSRLTKVCKRIEKFASKLETFFEVISIFVQTNPEYSGLVWGTIRLVFLLGTGYVTFLERLSAMMERMAASLPAYFEYAQNLRSKARLDQGDGNYKMSGRLLKAFAYVFADILQFCQEACGILSKHGKGFRKKASFITALIWNPFDKRFNDLILRFEDHKKLFELEMDVASNAEALRFYTICEENMRNGENQRQKQTLEEQKQERQDLAVRIKDFKQWISPPLWQESLDRAKALRSPSTGLWLLEDRDFQSWLSTATTTNASTGPKILHVTAKPGYGKTTLCGLVIEHLMLSQDQSSLDTSTDNPIAPSTAFYFFEEQRKRDNSVSDALRAMLAQLVHIHRDNKEVIDVLSVLWDKDETGQTTATANEVFSIWELLLGQTLSTTLVFDAIDECSDAEAFFQTIYTITKHAHHVPILIFSRPTVKIPRQWTSSPSGYCSLDLRESQNLEDMVSSARPKMVELLDSGALAHGTIQTADEIALNIAMRANGMFLWISLLFEYLQSPALSVRERLDALENVNRLEGLDTLCSTILASLKRRYHGNSRTKIKRAFQWVTHAFHPLHIVELNTALNVPLDRAITPEDLIPNFKDSIVLMSGALLEISSDMSVHFIHLSVKEFFTGTHLDHFDAHGFDFQSTETHRHLASSCLSYFCYSIPSVPLSGSASITPDATVQHSKFPLLEYVSRFWSRHLSDCLLGNQEYIQLIDESYSWDHLASMLSQFLYNKSMITVWIEASWLFATPPELIFSGTQSDITHFLNSTPPHLLPQFKQVLADMRTLSSDLQILNASWSNVLKTEPNEIWQPSISAFQQSNFWTRAPGSRLLPLGQNSNDDTGLAVLCSQVSSDGSRIGIVKGKPGGWIASEGLYHFRYEIRTVHPDEMFSVYAINISKWASNRHGPIVISRDLRKVSLRDLLLKFDINRGYENTRTQVNHPFQLGSEYGAFSEAGFSCHYVHPIWIQPNESENHAILRSQVCDDMQHELIDRASEYRDRPLHLQLSPTGEYILAVVESARLLDFDQDSTISARLWIAEVFQDTRHHLNDTRLESQSLTYYFPPSGTKIEWLDREVAFHPFLPQLALSRRDDTCLWDYKRPAGANLVTIHKSPLARLSFTADGKYLYGTTSQCRFRYPETHAHYDQSSYEECLEPVPGFQCQHKDVSIRLSHSPLLIDESTYSGPDFNSKTPNKLASTNSSTLTSSQRTPVAQSTHGVHLNRNDSGATQISMLRDIGSQGALVLQTVREDGAEISETLTRLPEGMRWNSSATIIAPNTTGSEETVRIVLNKTYTTENSSRNFEASPTCHLPAILERTRSTIPTFISRNPLALEETFTLPQNRHSNARRKRWNSSGGRPWKRAKRHPTRPS